MSNVFENLNPYKTMVFMTYQAAMKNPELLRGMQEQSRILQVIQLDPLAKEINGSVPQEAEIMQQFLDKNQFGSTNHMTLVSDPTQGPIVDMANNSRMALKGIDDVDLDAVIEFAYSGGASLGI